MSSTLTIRIDDDIKTRLDQRADFTDRGKSFLAAQAMREFVENEDWQISEIQASID